MTYMKAAVALLFTGMIMTAAPLHAESDSMKSSNTPAQETSDKENPTASSPDKDNKDTDSSENKASKGDEPECN